MLMDLVFPDWIGALFNGTGANRWWISEVAEYYSKIKFDGIWIDMSEVSSFCVGSCGSDERNMDLPRESRNEIRQFPEIVDPTNVRKVAIEAREDPTPTSYLRTTPTPGVRNVNWPPYAVNNFNGDLAVHAVSPNATHHGGIIEYDVHNVYGHQILNATYHALLNVFPEKRPFIIGRSQFAGSGKWAGHWG